MLGSFALDLSLQPVYADSSAQTPRTFRAVSAITVSYEEPLWPCGCSEASAMLAHGSCGLSLASHPPRRLFWGFGNR